VTFHDGHPLTSRDVKWTFDSLLGGKILSTKAATYRNVDRIDAPEDLTVIFHLKEPNATLLWNLSEGAIGIVPYGSLDEITAKPIGSGPFRFVSAEQDKDLILERYDNYWGSKARLARVRFIVVPDTTTRALELRKGSADVAINALTSDMVLAIATEQKLAIERAPGTILSYMAFNLRDPLLKDVRVRQAIAYAVDRQPLIEYIWRGFAQPAASVLPPQSWAYDPNVPVFRHDPEKARQILDAAGYRPVNGIRFHMTMKTSTEESTRLLAAVLQQQLRDVGIALDIRTYEFATFLADVTSGAFQFYSLRWIGGNEDHDIFDTVFHSRNIPPKDAIAVLLNPRVDSLIDQARRE
jgi:peptide/nickel transport system substrate-binding protein